MLVELGLVEQRYKAVCEVLDGATVIDVARRNGVARQTVHEWLRRYASGGLAGLADRSSKPASCPHQMAPEVEARIVELRRANPGWGPRTILHRLGPEGVDPLPGRSSVHRALVRHGLIDPTKRRRPRADYKRWERSRSMELWQMDIVGRFHLADGTEVSVVTGIDDHSRFCVCAPPRAAGHGPAGVRRPGPCDAHPRRARPDPHRQRQGLHRPVRKGPGPVLFDRICAAQLWRHQVGEQHRSVGCVAGDFDVGRSMIRPPPPATTGDGAARSPDDDCLDRPPPSARARLRVQPPIDAATNASTARPRRRRLACSYEPGDRRRPRPLIGPAPERVPRKRGHDASTNGSVASSPTGGGAMGRLRETAANAPPPCTRPKQCGVASRDRQRAPSASTDSSPIPRRVYLSGCRPDRGVHEPNAATSRVRVVPDPRHELRPADPGLSQAASSPPVSPWRSSSASSDAEGFSMTSSVISAAMPSSGVAADKTCEALRGGVSGILAEHADLLLPHQRAGVFPPVDRPGDDVHRPDPDCSCTRTLQLRRSSLRLLRPSRLATRVSDVFRVSYLPSVPERSASRRRSPGFSAISAVGHLHEESLHGARRGG